jgi:hypothetical protein
MNDFELINIRVQKSDPEIFTKVQKLSELARIP